MARPLRPFPPGLGLLLPLILAAPDLGAFQHAPIIGAMKKSTHTREHRAILAELRRVREAAGISQRALATRLQVHASWVAKVETGERRIDLMEFRWFVLACGGDPVRSFTEIVGHFPMPPATWLAKEGRGT